MAQTSYLARVIYREITSSTSGFAGDYQLLMPAKSIGSPIQPPNNVESTDLECAAQTYELGIKTSDTIEITGNLDAPELKKIAALEGKKLQIIHLYGTDGVGGAGIFAYEGQVSVSVNDVGGVDEILEMTVTTVPSTPTQNLLLADTTATHGYECSYSASTSKFTIAAKSS